MPAKILFLSLFDSVPQALNEICVTADVPEATRAMELAVEDESHFIDFKRSAMWIAKERVFIDRR